MQAAKPDIVILQEVYTEEFLENLSQHLGMKYYIGAGNRRRKVALLSKHRVLSFQSHHPIFPIWRNFVDAVIEYEKEKIIQVIGVHPIANLGVAFEVWRFWEAKYILNYVRRFQDKPFLLGGDFNAIASGEKVNTENVPAWLRWILYLQGNRVYHFSIGAFRAFGLIDCFRSLHSAESGFTLPPPKPNARLDYIFINAVLEPYLEGCWVVNDPESVNFASDHYPVLAEFKC
ncbi:MAG: endonuclease/exonuclease/phosphatase family protein [Anaerolineales bacterium]